MTVEWRHSDKPVPYEEAVRLMEERVAAIRSGAAGELVWLLEHPPLYTAGTSAKDADLLDARFPVYKTGRGGQYTYHGPGQRVAYVMLDLKKRQKQPDIRLYVRQLEEWIIKTLQNFDIKGERREGRVGIWVSSSPAPLYPPSLPEGGGRVPGGARGEGFREAKIAAIGVRVRHWVTYHGISINLDPDLSHFGGIVPCGVNEHGVTSISKIAKRPVTMAALDEALQNAWMDVFGEADVLKTKGLTRSARR